MREVSLRFKYHVKGQRTTGKPKLKKSFSGRQSARQSLQQLLKSSPHIKFLQFEELSLLECHHQVHDKP